MIAAGRLETVRDASVLDKARDLTRRASFSRWMLLLVGGTLFGYAVFGVEYFLIDRDHRDLLRKNSIYIELEQHVRTAAISHQVALFAATNAATPQDTVQTTATEFVENIRAAALANKVPALESQFAQMLDAAQTIDSALSASPIEVEKVAEGLNEAVQTLDLLVIIAGEGRIAEWNSLLEGNQSNFVLLSVLILAGAVLSGVLGYLITTHIRRTFADVIRINAAIAENRLDVDIPQIDGRTEAAQIYSALNFFRQNAVERMRLEKTADDGVLSQQNRQGQIEKKIGEFRSQVQELLVSVARRAASLGRPARDIHIAITQ